MSSTTIDSKVVEMSFDNKNFETNVKTTMSTLDKLKEKLNFKDSEKSLESLEKASEKVTFDEMSDSLDQVSKKFSVWETVAWTAINKITSAAIDAGVKMAKSLSVDNITSGYKKYEQKTGYVQTLVNSTGMSMEQVGDYLDKLMWFSDETSYSFTDMTSSLATLMASGADIDKMIPMIMGMANATSYAGKSASEFSRVIYNMNQSYSAGALTNMDWKSVQLAGVNSKALIEELIKAGAEVGTLFEENGQFYSTISGALVDQGNFANTLKDKWATTEVMERAFGKFAAATQEAYELINSGQFETASEAYEYLAKTEKYAGTLSIIAAKSAQEAKSWSEVVASVTDAVSSKWMQLFEVVLGDYSEVKELMTELANRLWDVFAGPMDGVIAKFTKAFKSPWSQISKAVRTSGIDIEVFQKKLGESAKELNGFDLDSAIEDYGSFEETLKAGWLSIDVFNHAMENLSGTYVDQEQVLKEYRKVIKDIWAGAYGNGADRVKALSEAGYDYNMVQEMVNRTVSIAGHELEAFTEQELEALMVSEDFTEAIISLADQYDNISDLFGLLGKDSGRQMMVSGIINLVDAFQTLLAVINDVWTSVMGEFGWEKLYGAMEGFFNWTEKIREALSYSEEDGHALTVTAYNLKILLTGLARVIKSISRIISNVLGSALSVIRTLFGAVNEEVEQHTSSLGAFLIKLSNWIDENERVSEIVGFIAEVMSKSIRKVKEWVDTMLKSEPVSKTIGLIFEVFKTLGEYLSRNIPVWIDGLRDFYDTINANGLVSALANIAKTSIKTIGQNFINRFQQAGESVSKFKDKLLEMGTLSLAGIGAGLLELVKELFVGFFDLTALSDGLTTVFSVIKEKSVDDLQVVGTALNSFGDKMKAAWQKLKDVFGGKFPLGEMFALLYTIINIVAIKKLATWIGALYKPFKTIQESITGMFGAFGGAGTAIKGFFDAMTGVAYAAIALEVATAVLILSVAISTITKSASDPNFIAALFSVAVLVAAIAALGAVASETKGSVGMLAIAASLIGIAYGIKAINESIKGVMSDDFEVTISGIARLIGLFAGALLVLFVAVKTITKVSSSSIGTKDMLSIVGVLTTFLGICAGLWIIVKALDQFSKISSSGLKTNMGVITDFILTATVSFAAISAVNKFLGHPEATLLSIAGSLLLFIVAIKMINKIDIDEITAIIGKLITMAAEIGVLTAIVGLIGKAGSGSLGLGKQLLGLSVALIALSLSLKILSNIDPASLIAPTMAMSTLLIALGICVRVMTGGSGTALATAKAFNVLATYIGLSFALITLTAAIVILSKLDPKSLVAPVASLGILLLTLGATVKMASSGINTASISSIIALALGTSALAGALILLSKIKWTSLLKSTVSLVTVMLTLSHVLKTAGDFAQGAKFGGIVGLVVVIGTIVGSFIYAAKMMENMDWKTLAAGFGGMALALVALSTVIIAASKFNSTVSFLGVLKTIGVAIAGVGLLFAAILGASWLVKDLDVGVIDHAMDILYSVTYGLGKALGGIFNGVWKGLTGSKTLDDILNAMVTFAEGLDPLFVAIQGIDGSKIENLATLIQVAYELSNAYNTLSDIDWSDETGLGSFMNNYGDLLISFNDKFKDLVVSEDSIHAVEVLSKSLASVNDYIPRSGGIWDDIFGSKDMESFGESMISYTTSLLAINELLGNNTSFNTSAYNSLVSISSSLSKIGANIPRSGGWVDDLIGSRNVSKFMESMGAYFEGINTINELVKSNTIEDGSFDSFSKASTFINGMFDDLNTAASYKNVALFTGVISNVNSAIKPYLISVADLYKEALEPNMESLNGIKVSVLHNIETIGPSLLKITDNIPTTKQYQAHISGTDIMNWGNNLKLYVTYLSQVGKILNDAVLGKGFDDQIDKMFDIARLVDLTYFPNAENFMDGLAEACLTEFSNYMASDATRSAIGNSVVSAFAGMTITNFDPNGGLQSRLEDLLSTGFGKIISKSDTLIEYGLVLASNISEGLTNNKVKMLIDRSAKSMGESILARIVEGILENERSLTTTFASSFRKAIKVVNDLIGNTLNSSPVIRPVVDISGVTSGIKDINGMLNGYTLDLANGNATAYNAYRAAGVTESTPSVVNNYTSPVNATINVNGAGNPDEVARLTVQKLNTTFQQTTKVWN